MKFLLIGLNHKSAGIEISRFLMKSKKSFTIIALNTLLVLAGCRPLVPVRNYKEIFHDEGRRFMQTMGDQKTYGMPDDDIHAGLSGNMPHDDIHAGLLSNMPDDDIHRGLKSKGGMPSSMAMPADPAMQKSLEASVDRTPLLWQTPQGWSEQKGKGMRLATFTTGAGSPSIETTIISLGGQAGGLSSNVVRWINQLQLPALDDSSLQKFIQSQEKLQTADGMPAVLVDLTSLQERSSGAVPSMIAAIVDKSSAQIFIKMTGSKSAVLANKDQLKNLVKSIKAAE